MRILMKVALPTFTPQLRPPIDPSGSVSSRRSLCQICASAGLDKAGFPRIKIGNGTAASDASG